MIKKIFYFFVVLLVVNTVQGTFLYVTPNELFFDNVLVGGYAEETVTITTDSETPLQITPIISGDIKSWVSFEPATNLEVRDVAPLLLKVIIKPPIDGAIGTHSGDIIIIFTNEQAPLIGKDKESSFSLKIKVTLTFDKIKKLVINKIEAKDTEIDHPIDFFINAENQGNEELHFNIEVMMKDRELTQSLVLKPTEKKNVLLNLPSSNLTIGKHTANVRIVLDDSLIKNENVTFYVKESNSFIRKGNLLDIQNPLRVHEGDEVTINALFKNLGEISTDCMFQGEVFKDNEPISELISDLYYCPVGEAIFLSTHFIASHIGEYRIIGKVYYDNTVSDEVESIVQVVPLSENTSTVPLSISPYLLFILIIAFMFITRMILKKRIAQ